MCLLLLSVSVRAAPVTLTAEDWARSRTGAALTQQPALAATVKAFEGQADAVIVIAHGSDEAGQLWAEELRSWLVAFGITSARIHFESRPGLQNTLVLDVRARSSL